MGPGNSTRPRAEYRDGTAHLGRLLDFAQPVAADVALDVAYGDGPIATALRPRVRHVASVDAGPRPEPRHPGPRAAPDTAPHALPQVSQVSALPGVRARAGAPGGDYAKTIAGAGYAKARAGVAPGTRTEVNAVAGAAAIQASTLALPYKDRVFTLVTAQLALHSLADPAASVREMLRVCRPDGRLIIAGRVRTNAASAARDRLERLRDPAHAGTPALSTLTGLLAAAGAEVRRLDVFVVERPAEPWLDGCDEARAEQIRAAMIAEIDGGPHTGVRPRLIGGELWFTQSWAHIAAAPG